MTLEKVGEFSESVIKRLGLTIAVGTPIYLGASNLEHMKKSHGWDFEKYGQRLGIIIAEPDYVGVQEDGSIEYIKIYGQHIKVAVRVAGDELFYARSLYHIGDAEAKQKIRHGKWKRLRVDLKK
jgi:hypothetical protein